MDIDLIEKGGVVMVILIGMSIYAFGVLFYKIQQFVTSGVFNTRFIDIAMIPVKRGELTEALRILAPVKSPVARIMRVSIEGIRNRDISMKSRESEISRVGSQELRYLESHMRGLEMIATTGPLLGLLGTVLGMIGAFSKLSEVGSRVDPSLLATGIWEALLTTVGGLVVAVPATAAYYMLDSMIEKVRAAMKDVTVQILALEDIFLRNEEEQRRVQREKELDAERKKLSVIEQQRRELEEREEALRKLAEEQEKTVAAMRSTPQATNTLRLLNPTYSRF
jgi:biopolymer transport protein ExbB